MGKQNQHLQQVLPEPGPGDAQLSSSWLQAPENHSSRLWPGSGQSWWTCDGWARWKEEKKSPVFNFKLFPSFLLSLTPLGTSCEATLAKSGRCLGEIQIYHDLNSCSGHVGGLFPVFFCTQCFADDLVKPPSDNKPLFFWRPLQSPPLSINVLPCTPAGQGKAQWDPRDPHLGARGIHEPCALCWHQIQSLPSLPKEFLFSTFPLLQHFPKELMPAGTLRTVWPFRDAHSIPLPSLPAAGSLTCPRDS